jgi:hypothetical protein
MFVLCPWWHGSALLRSSGMTQQAAWDKWQQLNDFQKCLWLIDEVEARWCDFSAAHPSTRRAELPHWTTGEEYAVMAHRMAHLLETELNAGKGEAVTLNVAPPGTEHNKNKHKANMDTDPRAVYVPAWSKAYDSTMDYPTHVVQCLASQRF